jgi:hypothetical protein
MKILFALALVLGFAAPAFAGQYCTTTCTEVAGSNHCTTNCY